MRMILTFAVNAGLNFVLALIVARYLGPDEYGRYAVAMAAALVAATLLLDWLRLSATRFYSAKTRADEPSIRASLDATQAAITMALVGAGLGLVVAGVDLGLPATLVAGAAAAGAASASFEYHSALARARFADGAYARLVIVKNLCSFVLMIAGAYVLRDAAVVIAGLCLSVAAALLAVRRDLADEGASLRLAERRHVAQFLRYGLPLVVANAAYQAMPLINRAVAAGRDGFAEAGLFALAADVGVRLFASIGTSLDIYLFQVAVRADHQEGREAARRQIVRNITIVLALMLPAGAGYWLILPAFEALLVPPDYRGAFAAYSTILIPAFVAFCIAQYALNPVFQLETLTWPVTFAAAFGLIVDAVLVLTLPQRIGPLGFAWAQLGGYASSAIVLGVIAARISRIMPASRDLAVIVGGTTLMAGVLMPLREAMPPLVAIVVLPAAGLALYGAVLLAADLCGCRSLVGRRLSRT